MNPRILLCALAAGCFPIVVETDPEPPPVEDLCDPVDPNEVIAVQSGDGRDLVPTHDHVMVDLAYGEDDVEIVVVHPNDGPVPTEIFGNRQSFAVYPLVSWDADTTYELSVTHSCGTESFPFTTTPPAIAVDPATLLGTWAIDGHSWGMNTDPVLAETLRPDLYPTVFEVMAATTGTLDLRLAATRPSDAWWSTIEQDPCTPTVDVLDVPFDRNPSLRIDADLPTRIVGEGGSLSVTLQDGFLVTAFGDRWPLRHGGTLDTTLVDPVVDSSPYGASNICDAVETYGTSCQDCPDGGTTCLPYGGFLGMEMVAVPGLTLVPRTAEEIASDPDCGN